MIYINGRFVGQRTTGVQRTASQLVSALDERLLARPPAERSRFVLLCPPGTRNPDQLRAISARTVGRLTGHAWEQIDLLRHAREGVLVSLGNTGPLMHRRQIAMIHDVTPLAFPRSYSRRFRWLYRLMVPALGRTARRVLTVSDFSAGELTRLASIRPSKVRVVYNAADHIREVKPDARVVASHALEPGRFLLSVGSRAPHKNLEVVQQARSLVADLVSALVLVGGSDSRVFKADKHPFRGAVQVGAATDGELRALYDQAFCLVFPSRYEGFGLPPLEAMACGCAVIAADIPPVREVCGDAAVYFDPNDPRALADRITELAGNGRREELQSRGIVRAGRFSWKASADALLDVIDEIAAIGRQPGVPSTDDRYLT
jgi:glycosyltransferase involved in cell wall biosynthesis